MSRQMLVVILAGGLLQVVTLSRIWLYKVVDWLFQLHTWAVRLIQTWGGATWLIRSVFFADRNHNTRVYEIFILNTYNSVFYIHMNVIS